MKKMQQIFKKLGFCFLIIIFMAVLGACNDSGGGDDDGGDDYPDNYKEYRPTALSNVDTVLTEELQAGFNLFWETANTTEGAGYGLIADRFNTYTGTRGSVASMASVGYGLSTIPIGIEYDWITRVQGEDRAYKTLTTIANMPNVHGFYYHFVNILTGQREWSCEVSIIDTAILMNGILTVGQYFGGRVQKLAEELYEKVEWNWYFDLAENRFYMSYKPESGFSGHWDAYAEQLMVYILAAGSTNYKVGRGAYDLMKLNSDKASITADYDPFYMTYTGSLFTYQFSHAWCDFRNIVDRSGVNWFTNSVNATKASIAYAEYKSTEYSVGSNAWGFTACDGPSGYTGAYGSGPSSGNAHVCDGTVPPCGALGSIVFCPEEAIAAVKYYRTLTNYNNSGKTIWSTYGFKDAFNLDSSANGWFGNDIIGIDKGISVLMIENYISGMIWNIYMDNAYIQKGLQVLGFTKVTG